MNERTLFLDALEKQDLIERKAFVDKACSGNAVLRERIESLLRSHDRAGPFLDQPAIEQLATAEFTRTGPNDDVEDFSVASLSPSECSGSVGRLGNYEIQERIGEGGMGTVWRARQSTPVRRTVALKLIRAGLESGQFITRFEAERQALALMDHPNIAKVLDAGTTNNDRPFFVMELVEGIPITRYCDEHRLTLRSRLELFLPVCQAVQHAHQKGVIHRDLKPSNILVSLCDGRPIPKVIDFGVAKAAGQPLTEKTLVTNFGDLVGTLEYMSPEQAEINPFDIDTRSDIYSLGVLLYELLTGSTPFSRETPHQAGMLEMLRVIREQEPVRPSVRLKTAGELPALAASRGSEPAKLTKLVSSELDWIVMKALEKDRNRRYETASALAADVWRYLDNEPVLACPPSKMYRCRKFARRNRRGILTASVVSLAVLLTTAVSGTLIWRTNQELQQSLEREQLTSYFQRITLAHRDLSTDNLGRALTLLNECPQELRGWEWYYLVRLSRVEPVVLNHNCAVNCVAFGPDGKQFVTACKDGSLRVWNSSTKDIVLEIANAHSDSVASVAVHPGGRHVASAGIDCVVKVWDLATGKTVFSEQIDHVHVLGTSQVVAFSPDGRHLAASRNGSVNIWNWRTHELVDNYPHGEKRCMAVAYSRDGQCLATGTWQGALRLWHLKQADASPQLFRNHRRHPISGCSFSRDGGRLASVSFDRTVRVWNTNTGSLLHTLIHPGLNLDVSFSPDDRLVASAGQDRAIHIWDAVSGREVLTLRGHHAQCTSLEFSPDGHYLASASQDGTVRLWDATPLRDSETQEVMTFSAHRDEVHCVAVSPDRSRVASADFGRVVNVWDPASGRVMLSLPNSQVALHDQVVFWLAWHPDGRRIASAGSANGLFTVEVWNAETGRKEYSLPRDSREYPAVAFSPDGRFLVTGRADGVVQAWDAQTGRTACAHGTIGSHSRAPVRGVAFSRDGRHLASAAGDGSVKLWDATRLEHLEQPQQPRHTFSGHVPGVSVTFDFSPDGRRLAMADQDFTVTIRDVATGRPVQTLRGHTGEVHAVAFSPAAADGWIATSGEDSIVKIWHSNTGELARNFRGHTALVTSLAFSPDGKWLYSASRDRTVKVWDMTRLRDSKIEVHQRNSASLEAALPKNKDPEILTVVSRKGRP